MTKKLSSGELPKYAHQEIEPSPEFIKKYDKYQKRAEKRMKGKVEVSNEKASTD